MIHWLASFPKSGSTWARAVLEAYKTGRLDINQMSSCASDNFPYFYEALAPCKEMTASERRLIRPAVLLHLTKFPMMTPLVLKTHHVNAVIDDIALIPPTVTKNAVYLIRDPRDVALSYARHFGYSVDDAIDSICDKNRSIGEDHMEHVTADWSFHVKSWTCEKRFKVLVVKYEQMLADPLRAFTSLLTYLGFEVDQERLLKAIQLASFSNLKVQESVKGFQEKKHGQTFFTVGRSGQWQSELTEVQISKIENSHSEVMHEFGYAVSRNNYERPRWSSSRNISDCAADHSS